MRLPCHPCGVAFNLGGGRRGREWAAFGQIRALDPASVGQGVRQDLARLRPKSGCDIGVRSPEFGLPSAKFGPVSANTDQLRRLRSTAVRSRSSNLGLACLAARRSRQGLRETLAEPRRFLMVAMGPTNLRAAGSGSGLHHGGVELSVLSCSVEDPEDCRESSGLSAWLSEQAGRVGCAMPLTHIGHRMLNAAGSRLGARYQLLQIPAYSRAPDPGEIPEFPDERHRRRPGRGRVAKYVAGFSAVSGLVSHGSIHFRIRRALPSSAPRLRVADKLTGKWGGRSRDRNISGPSHLVDHRPPRRQRAGTRAATGHHGSICADAIDVHTRAK